MCLMGWAPTSCAWWTGTNLVGGALGWDRRELYNHGMHDGLERRVSVGAEGDEYGERECGVFSDTGSKGIHRRYDNWLDSGIHRRFPHHLFAHLTASGTGRKIREDLRRRLSQVESSCRVILMSHLSGGRPSQRGVRPHLGRQQRQSTVRSRGRKELRGQKKNTVYDGKGTLEEGETAEAQFIKIQVAYELLMDVEKRRQYDIDNRVNPMEASQAWMQWLMKSKMLLTSGVIWLLQLGLSSSSMK
ncbi:hypothetical protein LOK49_LG08G00215 [Camellia lanceoleosa]|uniref:Uncharacterized protein n=1 Tax=Camellia lanceoleosa TaxID=1840588 RepID=A0ACC0GRP8_9ERIC|nr:hypothetical protein LOK49_LG08G00215 [Camellia lanceoleosa]